MTAMKLHRYPSPSGGVALGKIGAGVSLVKRLPYDAEVEYLKSTGTQYVDTNYIPTINSSMEIDVICTSQSARYTGVAFCGDYYNSTHSFGIARSSSREGIAYFGNINNKSLSGFSIDKRVRLFLTTQALTLTDVNTGTERSTSVNTTVFGVSSRTLFLLNGNTNTADLKIHANFMLYGCRLWQSGVLVRDFIPVRKGNVGYLYDRVSGRLFGNAGTGAFAYGHDIQGSISP